MKKVLIGFGPRFDIAGMQNCLPTSISSQVRSRLLNILFCYVALCMFGKIAKNFFHFII